MSAARALARSSSIAVGAVLVLGSFVLAQATLEYQDRGDRWEGVRPKPVSGFDIELISVMVDPSEPTPNVPDRLRVEFFLPTDTEPYLTVREQDYRFYYWLDQVKPPHDWRPGSMNEFVWNTAPVLHPLFDQGLKLEDLGALVRLGKKSPSAIERVAPAILYHSRGPAVARGYLFTMKTGADATVHCSIYKEGDQEPVSTQTFQRTRGGRPFTMKWDASSAAPADYRLVTSGHFLDDNQPVNQVVSFRHRDVTD